MGSFSMQFALQFLACSDLNCDDKVKSGNVSLGTTTKVVWWLAQHGQPEYDSISLQGHDHLLY